MIANLAADLLVLIHFGFILFVTVGGLLVLKWHKIAYLHIPCVFWGVLVEVGGEIEVGEELPPLDVELTAAIIVGGALASRDYTPVHHDAGAAREQGLPDVIMNILTTQGLCSRYVTDWAGPDAQIKNVKIKLKAMGFEIGKNEVMPVGHASGYHQGCFAQF